ncbi:metallophosphoesterase family protein [Stenotrophomonas sp. PD6]|uniref:metallophosphoesterase family protein n=1 Tax=Stenotrophomonas sp. PD6 TaxID=3368612 RepID=UPI003BA27E48
MNSACRRWCVVAFLAVGWCHAAEDAQPSPTTATNIMPGCEVTSTRPYKSYISSGWNSKSPHWVVVASDPQYPRTRNADGTETDQNSAKAAAALTAVLSDIGKFRDSVKTSSNPYTPVIINGDLTDFGHGWQRQTMQSLFLKLAGPKDASNGPLFFPGLGNHDYSNNVNDCTNNGCARDSVCDVLQWTKEIGPRNWDYHYAKPGHRGSYGYSVDVYGVTFIELHDSPMYQTHFESGGFPINEKVKFEVTSSLRWLEGALRDARSRNHIIFLNMHRRNGWPAGDTATFKRLIESYGVQAVFAGHVHDELGKAKHDAHFGSVPVYQSGALLNQSYLIVELVHGQKVRIYAVEPAQGYIRKRLIEEIPLKNGVSVPAPNFSDAAMVLYEGNNATQDFQCEVPLAGYPRFNMGSTYGCPNDEAKSLRILKAKKGTRIELFGNWDQKPDQAFAVIEVKEDITTPVMVGSFERKWEEANWKIQRYGEGTLDGKISSVAVSNGIDFSRGTVTLFEGNGGTEKALCTKSLTQDVAFDMGGSSGCANDEAKSALIRNARRGTEVCLFGNWKQQTNQGYSCIVALNDFTQNLVWTFNTDDWNEPDGSYKAYNRNGNIDGKISSMRIRKVNVALDRTP